MCLSQQKVKKNNESKCIYVNCQVQGFLEKKDKMNVDQACNDSQKLLSPMGAESSI